MEPGRPPVLDDVKKREICAILAFGGTRALAAQYVGCVPKTIANTAARDEDFALQLDQAESRFEFTQLKHISSAGEDGRYWRAAAWALEHKYPNRYGQRRADVVTVEQISQVLAQFAEVIFEEVAEPEYRQRILARLSDLTAGLQAATVEGGKE